ncbi:starch-binding protein SusD [Bacteroidia bacterium]|nr:starch-binding protein SusD [Bacteroidia bacterium]
MKNTFKIISAVAAIVVGLASCVKDLDVNPIDPNVVQEFNQEAVFAKIYGTLGLTGQTGPDGDGDVDGLDEGTSSFYRMMWELNEFPSDEVWWVWGDVGVTNVRACTWNSSNDLVKGLYSRLYFDITLCNLFLKETNGAGDENTIKQRAEVRFIRALNYYYLLDMYGEGVPFATEVGVVPMPITRADLYKYVIDELKDIESQMYADGAKPYYRADQVAAWLLLARIYLNAEVYTGTPDYNNAALYAGKVMTSSYTLAPEYKHLFMGDNDPLSTVNLASQEIILPIAQDGIETENWGGAIFLVASSRISGMNFPGTSEQWSCARSKKNLVEKFFPGITNSTTIKGDENSLPAIAADDRCLLVNQVKNDLDGVVYEATLLGGAQNGDGADGFGAGWGIAKFSNLKVNGEPARDAKFPDVDIPLLRIAEAYLTYAEAVYRGGTAANGSALDAVNALRTRAHADPCLALTEDYLLDEWAREFYYEGRRRTDLIRFNKFAGNVNYNWEGKGDTPAGQNVDAKYNLYPIPYSDLMANPNLKPTQGF